MRVLYSELGGSLIYLGIASFYTSAVLWFATQIGIF